MKKILIALAVASFALTSAAYAGDAPAEKPAKAAKGKKGDAKKTKGEGKACGGEKKGGEKSCGGAKGCGGDKKGGEKSCGGDK